MESSLVVEPLLEIFDGDRQAVAELLDEAAGVVDAAVAAGAPALAARDGDVVRAKAHAIKGCAANVGAQPLSRLAATIERAARDAQLETTDATIGALRAAVATFKTDVAAFKA